MKKITALLSATLAFSPLASMEINWSYPPISLSDISFNAAEPQIGIDSNGNLVAIWLEDDSLVSRYKFANANWSVNTDVIAPLGSNASMPRLFVGPYGNSNAIWVENGVIHAATRPFNTSWNEVAFPPTLTATAPEIVADSEGNAVAIWLEDGLVMTATKTANGLWPATAFTLSDLGCDSPRIAISDDGSGYVVAVWHATVEAAKIIYASSKTISGNWSPPAAISIPGVNTANPQVAVDSNGNAVAIWFEYSISLFNSNYTNVALRTASLPVGGSWTTPETIGPSGMFNPNALVSKVGFDGNGNAIAVWNNSPDGSNFSIQSMIKPVDGSWSTLSTIVDHNLFAYSQDLSVNAFGNAFIAYMYYDSFTSALMIQTSATDIAAYSKGFWSCPLILSDDLVNGYPRIVSTFTANTLNNVAAIWINNSGSANNEILSSTGTGFVLPPPSHLTVTQNSSDYTLFEEYFNVLRWCASPDPAVSGYLVFRNDVLVAELPSYSLQWVDDNRNPSETVIYSVAAIDHCHRQSKAITVQYP